MSRAAEKFGDGVLECTDDINAKLPALVDRFNVMVVVSAFAQHVGGGLQLLMQRNICDARQARLVLRHIEQAAFRSAAPTKSRR
jgi:hypothetical protein